jgi:drug/metabolite transporter (DMT)-like permease
MQNIIFPLLSSLFSSFLYLSVFELKGVLSNFEILFTRSLFITLILLPFVIKKINIDIVTDKYLLLRCFFGALALLLFFFVIQNGSALYVAVISTFSPLVIFIFDKFIYKIKLNKYQIFGMIILVSFTFLLKFRSEIISTKLILLSLVAVFFSSLAFICLRNIKKSTSSISIVFIFAIFVMLLTLFFSDFKNIYLNITNPYLITICVAAILTQYFLTLSYKKLDTTVANSILKLNIIWIYIYEVTKSIREYSLIETLFIMFILLGAILLSFRNNSSKTT